MPMLIKTKARAKTKAKAITKAKTKDISAL